MDSVNVSKVLEDVSAISVKIIFGEIQTKNAMVSHKCHLISSTLYFTFLHLVIYNFFILF
jgi:hypothetical protein